MTSLPLTRPNPDKPDPKSGAIQLEWNVNGSLLLARFGSYIPKTRPELLLIKFTENAPTAVHIFTFPAPSQPFDPHLRSVLLHNHPVLYTRWNPVRSGSLLLCCGTGGVYTWTSEWDDPEQGLTEVAECVGVPAGKPQVVGKAWIFFDPHHFSTNRKLYSSECEVGTRWKRSRFTGPISVLLCI